MTPRQMQISFIQYFESMGLPALIESDEIMMFINAAQISFVNSRYASRLNIQRLGFEQSQERIDDLRVLVTKTSISTYYPDIVVTDGFFADAIDFPANYLHLINQICTIWVNPGEINIVQEDEESPFKRVPNELDGVVKRNVICRLSQEDDIIRLLDDPFNRTTQNEPIGTIEGSSFYVYTDATFVVDSISIVYLRVPLDIVLAEDPEDSVSCELPDHLHREIVDMAIAMYKRNIARAVPQETVLTTAS